MTAPINPPIKAWEELLGSPKYQVKRFHRMAPSSVARITSRVTEVGVTISLPIVSATATPKMNGPENSAMAVTTRATRGGKAREKIIVETTLLESWMPFRKSNPNAKTIKIMIKTGMLSPEVRFS
jgi:hypothetical protein